MDCRQVHQAYSVYLQGKLSPHQAEWVSRHIQECPDCLLLDRKVRLGFLEEKLGDGEGQGPSREPLPDPPKLRKEDWLL